MRPPTPRGSTAKLALRPGAEELQYWTVEEEAEALDDRKTQGAASKAASGVRTNWNVASASAQTSGSTAPKVAASRRLGYVRGQGEQQARRS